MVATKVFLPKSELEEFVVCYYFSKSDNFDFTGFANPTIHQELFFNFGENFELHNNDGNVYSSRNWLSGIQSKSSKVKTNGKHLTAGVIFKPWGLYAAFGIDAKDICDKSININVLCDFKNQFNGNNIDDEQFFDLMEYLLTRSLKRVRLNETMKSIIKDMQRDSLSCLSRKFNCSKKSIIQSYNKMVGLSPQKFFTLKSICDSISKLQKEPSLKLTELAYEQGFYDQAHFTKVFKEHMGLTPKEFRSKNR